MNPESRDPPPASRDPPPESRDPPPAPRDPQPESLALPVNFLDATVFLTRKSVHLWDLRHRFGAGGSLLSSDSTLKGLVFP